jgi:hypothetical protein
MSHPGGGGGTGPGGGGGTGPGRGVLLALLHPQPLRSLGQQVAAHAEHVAARPVAAFPVAATPHAWGRKSC